MMMYVYVRDSAKSITYGQVEATDRAQAIRKMLRRETFKGMVITDVRVTDYDHPNPWRLFTCGGSHCR